MELLSNKALSNLSEGNDLLGTKPKSDIIQFFIENVSNPENEQNMIALYGGWGSGKTSLMRDIESNLNDCQPVFFEAWKHEKDNNIALSLLSALIADLKEIDGMELTSLKELMLKGVDLFQSTLTSSKVSVGLPGEVAKVGVDLGSVHDKYKELQAERYMSSFLDKEKAFVKEFKKIESKILEKTGKPKIVVFVDDLDRCEPDMVLDLLSAIKLFFTFGNKIIFVCGIDKEAVKNAIETKYKSVVKSEEYLEKIFDYSFQIPETLDTYGLVDFYFEKIAVKWRGEKNMLTDIVCDFFEVLEFNNPRHLKKVLNKYALLTKYKESKTFPEAYEKYLPNIIVRNNSGYLMDTLITLYVIILSDFFPDKFEKVFDGEDKLKRLAEAYMKSPQSKKSAYNISMCIGVVRKNYFGLAYSKQKLNYVIQDIIGYEKALKTNTNNETKLKTGYINLFTLFLACDTRTEIITENFTGYELDVFLRQFNLGKESIDTRFCEYLNNYSELLFNDSMGSDYPLENMKMISKVLL